MPKNIMNGNYISNVNMLMEKKNGKGKEYELDKYEGEYLNRKKKGKLYNYEEKLILEGEFLYNNKWEEKDMMIMEMKHLK